MFNVQAFFVWRVFKLLRAYGLMQAALCCAGPGIRGSFRTTPRDSRPWIFLERAGHPRDCDEPTALAAIRGAGPVFCKPGYAGSLKVGAAMYEYFGTDYPPWAALHGAERTIDFAIHAEGAASGIAAAGGEQGDDDEKGGAEGEYEFVVDE